MKKKKPREVENEIQEDTVREDLKELKKIFNERGIDFWLDCGSLLGAVRNGKLIPWDADIDLGVWVQDIKKIIAACLEFSKKTGFRMILDRNGIGLVRHSSVPISILYYWMIEDKAVNEWGPYQASRFFQRFLNIFFWLFLTPCYAGIFPIKVFGLKNFIMLSLANTGFLMPRFVKKLSAKIVSKRGQKFLLIIPKEYFVNLSVIKFYGMDFCVPLKIEEYLTYRYGKNWRIPKRDWVGAKEDGTLYKNNDFNQRFNLWLGN